MGNRVVFHVHDGTEMSPSIYGHWAGSHWKEIINELRDLMENRKGDMAYAAARLVGIIHERTPGALSLGIWNAPERPSFTEQRAAIMDKSYSHGDAGVILIDCRDFSYEAFNGYAEKEDVDES